MSTPSLSSASASTRRALGAALALIVVAACAGALEDVDAFAPPIPDGGASSGADSGSGGGEVSGGGESGGGSGGGESGGGSGGGSAGGSAGGESGGGAGGGSAGGSGGGSGGSDGGASDAGSRDGGTPDAGTHDAGCDAMATIIAPTCATSLCHSAVSEQGNLDLQSAGLPFRLVNQQASGGPGLLIDPVHPTSSVIYTKVSATPPYGAQMPLLGTPLTAAQRACILDWVEMGIAGQ